MQKISATILEFGQPFLDLLPEGASKREFEAYLGIVVTAWNAVVMDEWNHDDSMQKQFMSHLSSMPPAYLELMQALLGRKKQLFADDQRAVGHHELIEKNGEWVFRAEARGKLEH
ncbi:hypothetical protein D5125_09350 [Magnetovirga frankeli]|uniref:hypothetical protein n=1 Tax=Magnetovirga frankeli TaxID=947516 RepID=UPI00129387F1|nr:hypothetical protein D5125_09350 [gamma proteobacterium SS-5]